MLPLDIHHLELLVVIGGVSGGGKSKTLDILSDLGFFNIENIPVTLLPDFIELTKSNPNRYSRLAILPDISSTGQLDELLELLRKASPKRGKLIHLYLDCSSEVLIRRYSEVRRPHPSFDPERDRTLEDTIERERLRLLPFKECADLAIDTTQLTIHDLKHEVTGFIASITRCKDSALRLNFLSFGYKYGVPADSDVVMDVRFLQNPYFVDALKEKNGLDSEVSDFVLNTPSCAQFLEKYQDLLNFLIPQYIQMGKPYLNICIGCTGGKHRSVAIAEALKKRFNDPSFSVHIKHRDFKR